MKIEPSFWSYQKEVSRDRHAHPIGEKIHISALQRLFPDASTGKPYKPANLEKVLEAIDRTYEHGAGNDGHPGANSKVLAAFELSVVDWDGQEIPKHGLRADRLRQLLARRARDAAPVLSPGALQRA